MWVTELLPNTAKMVDDICFIRGMHTEAINHEPAITFMQTGNQNTGRPCLGVWTSYGLGSLNDDLPTFVVLVAQPTNTEQVQAISARLWSSGYLSGEHAGVSFRSKGDLILYINNPPGVPREIRRRTLDGLNALNELTAKELGDPLIIWGGEFGRTIYSQGGLSKKNYGRDHHPRCFTMWMCGGGSKGGTIYGETDDFSYNIVKDPVHVHDFHATILRLLGYGSERFSYKYQGLDQRLTGVEPAHPIKALMA